MILEAAEERQDFAPPTETHQRRVSENKEPLEMLPPRGYQTRARPIIQVLREWPTGL